MGADFSVILAVILCLCAIFGGVLGNQKNAGAIGVLLGLFLGPFGVIAAGLLDGRALCPHCQDRVSRHASICPHCRSALKLQA